ncbi:YndM family protein [Camelliibacillus cellulosilyticus]|uniref:YndM family protein n=1 Tax=Camelliibacillus cellulosilyticus TaxID=2174486 RepID=A0ABV9GSW7_9BACL
MKHAGLLILKFISSLIAFAIGFNLFFRATVTEIVSFSLFLTVASFFLVELFVLPRVERSARAVIDFFLAYVSVWIFGTIFLNNYIQVAWGSLLSAVIFTAAEIVVHRYIIPSPYDDNVRDHGNAEAHRELDYGTEIADEFDHRDRED